MRRVVRSRAQGFTLLELIIAVVILGIVVSATLESMSRQQKTSVVTEEVVEVQQNVRAIGSLLEALEHRHIAVHAERPG